jgi:multidrug efflux pump subunit AcrA (membrane-fusion protein)
LRTLERRKASADAELAAAEKALAAAKTDKALARAGERKAKAAERAAEARTRLESARAEAQAKIDAAAATKEAAEAASERMTQTAKAASEAKLDLEPVSIFISRATQKVYVRRNTRKPWPDGGEVYDATIEADVEIRDPDRPIGTHVFTAMAPAADGLRWSAVTIDDGDDAASALDRVTIPRDILDRIAPGARPRSSIIISDEPLSRETNYRTEFVAVLGNQPQGGFKTRRPTPPAAPPVVVSSPWSGGGGFFGFGFGYLQDPPPNRKPVKARPNTRRTYTTPGWW